MAEVPQDIVAELSAWAAGCDRLDRCPDEARCLRAAAAEITALRQEIARHHADFARWEAMADKGAAQLQELAALRSFRALFGQFIHADEDSAPLVFVELVQRHDVIAEMVR